MDEKFKMTKDQVKESPKDQILEGAIVDIELSTFAKKLDEDKKAKFENPEDLLTERLFLKFDCNGHIGEQTIPYHENPSDNTKLGKLLIKYGVLEVGTKVKVQFSGKGIGNILIE